MAYITRWVCAIYNFIVGDMYILVGTLFTMLVVGLLAPWSPGVAGLLFLLLIITTLTLSLRHEVIP